MTLIDYIGIGVIIISIIILIRKISKKDSSCGCGGSGKCQ